MRSNIWLLLCSVAILSGAAGAYEKTGVGMGIARPVNDKPVETVQVATPSNTDTVVVKEQPVSVDATVSIQSKDAPPAPVSQTSEPDMIADKSDATATTKPSVEMLEVFKPSEPVNTKATRCYGLLADLKNNADRIKVDLLNGGKEITRLVNTSDGIAKNIDDMSKIWPNNQRYIDVCSSSKRSALILNDELSSVPRRWTHVRMAYESMIQEVRTVRIWGRLLAESEPRPVAVAGKDGRVTYVDAPSAPIDPKIAHRNELIKRADKISAQQTALEQSEKNKDMPIDLDRNVVPGHRKGDITGHESE